MGVPITDAKGDAEDRPRKKSKRAGGPASAADAAAAASSDDAIYDLVECGGAENAIRSGVDAGRPLWNGTEGAGAAAATTTTIAIPSLPFFEGHARRSSHRR